jgi:hypothetical protein
MRSITLVVVALTLMVGSASAQPAANVGPGGQSCGVWMGVEGASQERGSPVESGTLQAILQSWVHGFVFGAYLAYADTSGVGLKALASVPDMPAIHAWLTNYCGAHPLDHLYVAAGQLVLELRRRDQR